LSPSRSELADAYRTNESWFLTYSHGSPSSRRSPLDRTGKGEGGGDEKPLPGLPPLTPRSPRSPRHKLGTSRDAKLRRLVEDEAEPQPARHSDGGPLPGYDPFLATGRAQSSEGSSRGSSRQARRAPPHGATLEPLDASPRGNHRIGGGDSSNPLALRRGLERGRSCKDDGEASESSRLRLRPAAWRSLCQGGQDLVELQRFPEASQTFLEALSHAPDSRMAQDNFARSLGLLKYDLSYRWRHWPFDPPPQQPPPPKWKRKVRLPLLAPPRIVGLLEDTIGPRHIKVQWDELTLPPEFEETHRLEIDSYEVEAAETCILDGLLPMKQVYDGPACRFKLGGLLPTTEVHFRVRAHNTAGAGPWSDEIRLETEEEPDEPRIPITEVPQPWLTVDIEDIIKDICKARGNTAVLEDVSAEVWGGLAKVLTGFLGKVKIAFRYYVLAGASGSTEEDPSSMGMSQFLTFVKGSGLQAKGQTISDFDRLFMRATREAPPKKPAMASVAMAALAEKKLQGLAAAATAAVATPDGTAAEEPQQGSPAPAQPKPPALGAFAKLKAAAAISKLASKKQSGMQQEKFVGALIRLAAMKFGTADLPGSLESLMERHVAPHVNDDLQLETDALSEVMAGKRMAAVLRRHQKELERIYTFYAAGDQSLAARGALDSLNVKEMAMLCEDLCLFDSKYGAREMLAAFVRVNIDDELYEAEEEGEEGDGDESELSYSEWTEMLVRIFNGREWAHLPKEERGSGDFEMAFSGWIDNCFVPTAHVAIKQKKRSKGTG